MKNQRRRSREAAFQVFFSMSFGSTDRTNALTRLESVQEEGLHKQDAFSEQLLQAVDVHSEEIEEQIDKALTGWRSERLTPADKSLLHLGVAEMMYFSDIPARVTINEYIEIAKTYSEAESSKFINGVLDRIRKNLEQAAK